MNKYCNLPRMLLGTKHIFFMNGILLPVCLCD